jgi:hypothetical protein
MRLNGSYAEFGDMNVLANGGEDGATIRVGNLEHALEAMPVEETEIKDQSMMATGHQSHMDSLTGGTRAEEDRVLQTLHEENAAKADDALVLIHLCSSRPKY